MRILVVDDSAAIRARLVLLVSEVASAEVYEACDGDQALELERLHRPAVVLLDLRLPGRSGLAVLRELKARSPAPVVVVLTAHPTDLHRRLCLSYGADYFFEKSADYAAALRDLLLSDRRGGDV